MSSLQRCPHYRGVLTTEVSSLQRCPHYRGILTTGVSSLQRCPHYRGILSVEVSSLHRCPLYRGVPTIEVSSVQTCPWYRGVLTTEVSSLQRCPHYRGVLTTEVSSLQRCPHYRGVLTAEVSSLQRCPHYRSVLTTKVSSLQRCPRYRGVLTAYIGVLATEASLLQRCSCSRVVLTTEVFSPQRCLRDFCCYARLPANESLFCFHFLFRLQRYMGMWSNDVYHGFGILILSDGTYCETKFSHGEIEVSLTPVCTHVHQKAGYTDVHAYSYIVIVHFTLHVAKLGTNPQTLILEYRISGNFGNIFNLAAWRSGSKSPNFYHQIHINLLTMLCPCCTTAKFKFHQYFITA